MDIVNDDANEQIQITGTHTIEPSAGHVSKVYI